MCRRRRGRNNRRWWWWCFEGMSGPGRGVTGGSLEMPFQTEAILLLNTQFRFSHSSLQIWLLCVTV